MAPLPPPFVATPMNGSKFFVGIARIVTQYKITTYISIVTLAKLIKVSYVESHYNSNRNKVPIHCSFQNKSNSRTKKVIKNIITSRLLDQSINQNTYEYAFEVIVFVKYKKCG